MSSSTTTNATTMTRIGTICLLCLVVSSLLVGCWTSKPPPPPPPAEEFESGEEWFEDVTDRVGLDFTHDPGPLDFFMPQ